MKFVICICIVVFGLLYLLTGCSTAESRRARQQAEQDRWNALTVDEKLTEIRNQQMEIDRLQRLQMMRRLK